MRDKGNGADREQDTGGNLREHGGFRLPHTRNALALGRFGFPLLGFASFFSLRSFVLLLIFTTLADVTPGFREIITSLAFVKLPPAIDTSNNVLSHGMSNSLRFISVVLTFNTIITYSRVKVKKNVRKIRNGASE